jgi:uncharacterized protein YndB with AHSA1/START domain
MPERFVTHATLALERTYKVPAARVFAAWSSPEALLRWGSPGEGWHAAYDRFDFRIGGGEVCRFGPPGGEVYVSEMRYEDIVPDARIVSGGSMTCGDRRLFVGLMTVELYPAEGGTRLVFTEQGAFLDGNDLPSNHEAGWNHMLDNLGRNLERGAAP